jgi:hypothetical protein
VSGSDDPVAGMLETQVPPEFLAAIRAVMPDGVSSSSAEQTVFQPCAAPAGPDPPSRLSEAAPGARPDLPCERRVILPAGVVRIAGLWEGARLPGVVGAPRNRIWVADADEYVDPDRRGDPVTCAPSRHGR